MLSHDTAAKQFRSPTKPFCPFDANILKPSPGSETVNEVPNWRQRAQAERSGSDNMFNPATTNSRRLISRGAAAFAALAIGAVAFSGTAAAAPLPLFPFIMTPPAQPAPPTQAAPSEDRGAVIEMPSRLKRQIVSYATREAPGTVIIDTPNTYLYYVLGGGQAIRYGIGVGRDGFTWSGTQSVTKKAEWPDWTPPPEMIARQPYLPRHMAGGPGNPLGARAMYLGGTVYRIHGTNAPETIGTRVSSGCIRLTNEDVADLYSRVNVGTRVIVLPMDRRADNADGKRG
jgi:lipoprotein-anchoring transpeptidase ErfK/SrfK